MTTMVSTPINVTEVFAALETWIKQRPKLDWRDYGCNTREGRAAYQSEIRSIGKDRQRAMKALDEARGLSPEKPELLADAFRAFSGRLQWKVEMVQSRRADNTMILQSHPEPVGRLEYCTGQYWPTEYRKAAASVLELYIATWRQAANADAPRTFAYHTMADVKAANQAIGNHWFDRSSMRFFNTRIESGLIGGRWFITSERFDDNAPRKFTVRRADPDGSVDTEGDFQQYRTLDDARMAARQLRKVAA